MSENKGRSESPGKTSPSSEGDLSQPVGGQGSYANAVLWARPWHGTHAEEGAGGGNGGRRARGVILVGTELSTYEQPYTQGLLVVTTSIWALYSGVAPEVGRENVVLSSLHSCGYKR